MEISNLETKFKPTIQWMNEKYWELNDWLFDGRLGKCNFDIFTSGKGSQGNVLGKFYMNADGLKFNKHTRRMFKQTYLGDRIDINSNNFYEYCKPFIALNGNYSATEKSWLSTLLHEMCHYWVYCQGRYPTQAHGSEFRIIANRVSSKANGLFPVERLASAEEMQECDIDNKYAEMKKKRLETKKSKVNAVFCFMMDDIQLTITSSDSLIREIVSTRQKDRECEKIIISNDINLLSLLFDNGYKKNVRTWRYWRIGGKAWLNNIYNYEISEIKCNQNTNESIILKESELRQLIENIVEKVINGIDDEIIDILPGQILS